MRERAKQVEYFDGPERTPGELREHYAALARLDRLIRFDRPFRVWLPQLLGSNSCDGLSVLDLGAGDGSMSRQLGAWAQTRGWRWQFTNLDLCPFTAELDPGQRHVTASVTALPFADGSFDIVIASMMTHHLDTDDEVVTHFKEASRVARRVVLLCDLHRNPIFYLSLWLVLRCMRVPQEFREDGLLSVRRGWRVSEWRRLARLAGLEKTRVWAEHGTRILLGLQKEPCPALSERKNTTITSARYL